MLQQQPKHQVQPDVFTQNALGQDTSGRVVYQAKAVPKELVLGMIVRLITPADAALLSNYYQDNAEHFKPWQPRRDDNYYSEAALFALFTEYQHQQQHGSAAHFIALLDGKVAAHCSLTAIQYGPFRACFIGYGVAHKHQGTGVMTRLCQSVISYAFDELQLNRIMANYMPSNLRSGKLLKKLGFAEEGVAKRYLQINGNWEDHILTSLLNPHSQAT